MQEMMDFALWFIEQLPGFLMTPPISGFVGLGFCFVIIALIKRLIHL